MSIKYQRMCLKYLFQNLKKQFASIIPLATTFYTFKNVFFSFLNLKTALNKWLKFIWTSSKCEAVCRNECFVHSEWNSIFTLKNDLNINLDLAT